MDPRAVPGRSVLRTRARRDVVWLAAAAGVALALGFVTPINDRFVEWIASTPFVHADLLVFVVIALGLTVFSYRRWREEQQYVAELREALAEVDTLSGLIPICSSCKRIRNEGEYWVAVEQYLASHSQASFSHAVCPECAAAAWAEFEADLATAGRPA
jgi:hypothetical protein